MFLASTLTCFSSSENDSGYDIYGVRSRSFHQTHTSVRFQRFYEVGLGRYRIARQLQEECMVMDGKHTKHISASRHCLTGDTENNDSNPSTPSRTSLDKDYLGDRPLLLNSTTATGKHESRDLHGRGAATFSEDGYHNDGLDQDSAGLDQDALHSSHVEHQLTVREAIKAYPMAVFWSVAVSMCVIMEGFDSVLVPNFYAFPTFQRKCMLSCSVTP